LLLAALRPDHVTSLTLISRYGPPDVLLLTEVEKPVPRSGEVSVSLPPRLRAVLCGAVTSCVRTLARRLVVRPSHAVCRSHETVTALARPPHSVDKGFVWL